VTLVVLGVGALAAARFDASPADARESHAHGHRAVAVTGKSGAGRGAGERSRAGAVPRHLATRRAPDASRQAQVWDPFTTLAMTAYLRARTGDITAALYDLQTGQTYVYRPGVSEQTASIIKVTILATLLYQSQLSGTPLTASEQYLASGMIEASDDGDAQELWDEVGGAPAIASFDSLAGLTDTQPNTEGYWGETMTTSTDQLRILEHLVLANSVLDDASRAYELSLMENVVPYDYWGVSTSVPAGVIVALKNGWVPIVYGNWQINSIGEVSGKGRSYLLAILTNENPTEQYGIDTTGGMSSLIWQEMGAAPETPCDSCGGDFEHH
jgi:hypothetical protein